MKEHQDMVHSLMKPGAKILQELTPEKANLIHAGVGVCGEAGELLDAIKKNFAYNKPIDRANVIEELGDIEFYLEAVRKELNITREETLKGNMEKLWIRYKGYKYSDQAAHERADKQ